MAPASSSIARLQQLLAIALAGGAACWLAWWWERSTWTACAGFVLVLLSHSAVLGLEFLARRFLGQAGRSGRPSWTVLAGAWAGETVQATRVFLWRQPFRWRRAPDHTGADPRSRGRRGVVFIHGLACNRGFWIPWLERVAAQGRAFCAVSLEPMSGPIDAYVQDVEQAVATVTRATGLAPLLVCHSMGGLAARAWLRQHGPGRVHHIVTIGTPHRGTWLARFGWTANGRQMRIGSDWLEALERETGQLPQTGFTCWYSDCDNIVFPVETATLPGADNRLVRGLGHVDLAFSPEVMQRSLALLEEG